MKIALIGYGKMGKEVEKIAIERGHTIEIKIDNEQDWDLHGSRLSTCDVAVEFTAPHIVISNLFKCFEAGIPVVTGTTGWYQDLEEVLAQLTKLNGALFYSSNFSVGVNILFEINRQLARLMNQYPMYEINMEEIHHTQKLDAPSGTAITLAEGILSEVDRKTSWGNQPADDPAKLYIRSVREGSVPGTHIITYESDIDKIEIRHEAKNRKGLALGAVMAAEFIAGKTGVFGMKDLQSIE